MKPTANIAPQPYDVVLCHRTDFAKLHACDILDGFSHPAMFWPGKVCGLPIWDYRTTAQRHQMLDTLRRRKLRVLEIVPNGAEVVACSQIGVDYTNGGDWVSEQPRSWGMGC